MVIGFVADLLLWLIGALIGVIVGCPVWILGLVLVLDYRGLASSWASGSEVIARKWPYLYAGLIPRSVASYRWFGIGPMVMAAMIVGAGSAAAGLPSSALNVWMLLGFAAWGIWGVSLVVITLKSALRR